GRPTARVASRDRQIFWRRRTAWGASTMIELRPNAQPRGAIQAEHIATVCYRNCYRTHRDKTGKKRTENARTLGEITSQWDRVALDADSCDDLFVEKPSEPVNLASYLLAKSNFQFICFDLTY